MRPACSQHCLNNAGSYKCTCDSEYYIAVLYINNEYKYNLIFISIVE